jgi:hypothetical protein
MQNHATSIAFVENQPSPSLISLSPLIISHFRALRRSRIRSVKIGQFPISLWLDHLVSGAIKQLNKLRLNCLADPLYKRYKAPVQYTWYPLFVHYGILKIISIALSLLFQNSFTVLFTIGNCIFYILEFDSYLQ